MTDQPFSIRAVGEDIIAVDCHNAYTRSKPSFLVPKRADGAAATLVDGRWLLETSTLRVEAEAGEDVHERDGSHASANGEAAHLRRGVARGE